MDTPQRRKRLMLRQAPPMIYVIGDVHGCYKQLIALEKKLAADCQKHGGKALVVFVGDLVDRGPDSARVLDHVLAAPAEGLQRVILAGNHEEMFLDFIDNPRPEAPWLGFGGRETLNSYGIFPPKGFAFEDLATRRLSLLVQSGIPDPHVDALRGFPASLRLPRYLISHAGIDLDKPLEEQTDRDLMWSNPNAIDHAARTQMPLAGLQQLQEHNLRVIHGHVPAAEPFVTDRRVSVDTHAYEGGKLTAACVPASGDIRFFSVT